MNQKTPWITIALTALAAFGGLLTGGFGFGLLGGLALTALAVVGGALLDGTQGGKKFVDQIFSSFQPHSQQSNAADGPLKKIAQPLIDYGMKNPADAAILGTTAYYAGPTVVPLTAIGLWKAGKWGLSKVWPSKDTEFEALIKKEPAVAAKQLKAIIGSAKAGGITQEHTNKLFSLIESGRLEKICKQAGVTSEQVIEACAQGAKQHNPAYATTPFEDVKHSIAEGVKAETGLVARMQRGWNWLTNIGTQEVKVSKDNNTQYGAVPHPNHVTPTPNSTTHSTSNQPNSTPIDSDRDVSRGTTSIDVGAHTPIVTSDPINTKSTGSSTTPINDASDLTATKSTTSTPAPTNSVDTNAPAHQPQGNLVLGRDGSIASPNGRVSMLPMDGGIPPSSGSESATSNAKNTSPPHQFSGELLDANGNFIRGVDAKITPAGQSSVDSSNSSAGSGARKFGAGTSAVFLMMDGNRLYDAAARGDTGTMISAGSSATANVVGLADDAAVGLGYGGLLNNGLRIGLAGTMAAATAGASVADIARVGYENKVDAKEQQGEIAATGLAALGTAGAAGAVGGPVGIVIGVVGTGVILGGRATSHALDNYFLAGTEGQFKPNLEKKTKLHGLINQQLKDKLTKRLGLNNYSEFNLSKPEHYTELECELAKLKESAENNVRTYSSYAPQWLRGISTSWAGKLLSGQVGAMLLPEAPEQTQLILQAHHNAKTDLEIVNSAQIELKQYIAEVNTAKRAIETVAEKAAATDLFIVDKQGKILRDEHDNLVFALDTKKLAETDKATVITKLTSAGINAEWAIANLEAEGFKFPSPKPSTPGEYKDLDAPTSGLHHMASNSIQQAILTT